MRRLVVGLAILTVAALMAPQARADDQKIAQQIVKQLQEQKEKGRLRGFGIGLEVDRGTVWMKGRVSTREQQRLVLEIARRVPGVQQVVNDLHITPVKATPSVAKKAPSGSSQRLDVASRLAHALKYSLTKSSKQAAEPTPAKSAKKPAPRTEKHDVRLASATESVEPPKTPAISRMLAALKGESGQAALKRGRTLDQGRLTAFQPSARPVAQAVATEPLAPAEKAVALKTAPAERAVALKTAPAAASKTVHTDEEISQTIQKKLMAQKQQGKLRGFQMDIEVLDGQVWISGHVATPEQHALVMDAARRVPGVRQVVNDLAVQSPAPTAQASAQVALATPSARPASAATAAPRAYVPYGPRPVNAVPIPIAPARTVSRTGAAQATTAQPGPPMPAYVPTATAISPARYDQPYLPGYAWPSYASYPNYAAVTYPRQYSATAWPYIGPFYPYPQVPLGWRKVTLQWDDGWWMLNFKSH